MNHRQVRRLAAVGSWSCLIVILIASFAPPSSVDNLGGSDKLGHFLAYAGLSLCWLVAGKMSARRLAMVFLGCVALGGAVEVLQPLLQRHGGWLDAGANGAGALFGVSLGWFCNRLIVQNP